MNTDLMKRVEPIMEAFKDITIANDTAAVDAGFFLQKVKETEKVIEAKLNPPIATAHKAHQALTSEKKFFMDRLKMVKDTINKKLSAWHTEGQRVQEEETRRLTELARKQTEDAIIEKALKTGDESLLERSVESVHMEAPAPVKIDKVAFVKAWKIEVIDADLVPREFLMPDEKKILAYVKMQDGKFPIPGVKISADQNVRVG